MNRNCMDTPFQMKSTWQRCASAGQQQSTHVEELALRWGRSLVVKLMQAKRTGASTQVRGVGRRLCDTNDNGRWVMARGRQGWQAKVNERGKRKKQKQKYREEKEGEWRNKKKKGEKGDIVEYKMTLYVFEIFYPFKILGELILPNI